VPGRNTPSAIVKAAQPPDFAVLAERGRPRLARPPGEESKVRARVTHTKGALGNRVNTEPFSHNDAQRTCNLA